MHPAILPGTLSPPRPAPPPAGRIRSAHELVVTEEARPGDNPLAVMRRVAWALHKAGGAEVIGLMLFGAFSARAEIEAALRATLGETDWPVLWIDGASVHGAPLAGAQAFALRGAAVERVVVDGRVVASRYRLGRAKLCWAGESLPRDPGASPGTQTTQAFRVVEASLGAAGFALGDLVRTWCYNHDLLAWYPEFNHARTALYRTVDFRLGATPASTGISAANRAGAALVLAGLAARPLSGGPVATPLASPLQCPAPAYGSSFSRAVELDLGNTRRVLVSGTASIEPDGATAWRGEVWNQVDLTMRVIEAILRSRGLDWSDATRGIAYFKSPGYAPAFDLWCERAGWRNPPVVRLHCDICRDDLLFELELDAEVTIGEPETD